MKKEEKLLKPVIKYRKAYITLVQVIYYWDCIEARL